jgi:hypothetical protein
MFRHQMYHPQGACYVTLLNYVSTIAALLQLELCNLARWERLRSNTRGRLGQKLSPTCTTGRENTDLMCVKSICDEEG